LLRTVVQDLPAGERRRLLRPTPASWPRLSEPRELVRTIADEYAVRIEGLEAIPHDVWAERALPDLDLIDRLSIVLAGCDLTVRWTEAGKAVEVVPLPERVHFADQYTIPAPLRSRSAELRQAFPGSNVEVSGARVEVDGMWSLHRGVQAWLAGATARPRPTGSSPNAEERLTLNVEAARLEDVVMLLEERLKLSFEWTDAAAEKRQVRVPLKVQDATLDELLEKITTAAGLKFTRDGSTVRLDVAPN
ncbi:MAG: STN domain-containing protein, partial [Planctomycetales bacterium]|nr:STN domain-containing protein [Planctomycetales bacterium]